MIVVVPRYLVAPAVGLMTLMGLMLAAGFCIGLAVTILFTEPSLLQGADLFAFPAAAFAAWLLWRLARQFTSNAAFDEDGGVSLFRQRGLGAWFVFLMMAGALAGGLALAVNELPMEREQRFMVKKNNQPAPPRRAMTAAKPASNAPAAKPVAARSPANVVRGSSGLRIQTIFYDETNPSAVINGETVKVGAKVGAWQVKAIGPRNVTLQNASGQMDVLTLK